MRTLPLIALPLIAGLGLGAPSLALAQQTGTGPTEQNLNSAGQFRNITSTGVTKPPGRAGAGSDDVGSDAVQKQKSLDRKIETGICIGCN
ncbi:MULTISPECIES: hypothetical protein [unclassified Methylobacterium]|uniref:hypothetical protein n=1 Tax=unclassified Methylobacterium TaxID=2615210 RepID=UPI0006F74250|nr:MULTISPECIES: hypothetical protein [unclassified Methylobacterium]KQP85643.1 hypothetical protein ASF60_04800 [Methylobacterium sp. Leaf113]KQP96910.1 hypothetical protein ASF57_03005 [Methylobacterium sp. Leaf117]MCK2052844.1 hypothetical protein [Methylobacterium sp. 37f]